MMVSITVDAATPAIALAVDRDGPASRTGCGHDFRAASEINQTLSRDSVKKLSAPPNSSGSEFVRCCQRQLRGLQTRASNDV
jgi:hypothetical protein